MNDLSDLNTRYLPNIRPDELRTGDVVGVERTSGDGAPGKMDLTQLQRPFGVPRLMSPVPPNAIPFFEDFVVTPIKDSANIGAEEGAGWCFTETAITGAARLIGSDAYPPIAGTPGIHGVVQLLASGSTACVMLDAWAFILGSWLAGYTDIESVGMWICSQTGLPNSSVGVGWVADSVAGGVDWISDPDTTLDGEAAIVITRHATALAGDAAQGVAAGDWVARVYTPSGVDDDALVLIPAAGQASGDFQKFEVRSAGGVLYFWANGVYKGSIAVPAFALDNHNQIGESLRPTAGHRSTLGLHYFEIDCYYHEVGRTTPR